MKLPSNVKLVEVGPRDGLQNEPATIPTTTKIEFVNRLSQTGLSTIEATSFVSARKIPQLADNTELLTGISRKPNVAYPVLVPNLEGFKAALAAGATHIAVFGAASETFSQKNINCSIAESLQRFTEVINQAKQHNIAVRGYISCALGCPYEGAIDPNKVLTLADELHQLGCYEISIGDTIGVGTAQQAQALMQLLQTKIPVAKLAAHFHDTYGQALANLLAVMQVGVNIIDASVAGLGGCPYARGATGNVATEDVLYMLNGLGIQTGVDLEQLVAVGQYICAELGRENQSRVALAHG